MQYIAFLRAVNVGKHNRVRMEDLRKLLESKGFSGVKTYLQTGNVWFESDNPNRETVATRLETLMDSLGCREVSVMVRTLPEMEQIIGLNPFGKPSHSHHQYVVFLREPSPLDLPQHKDIAVLQRSDTEVFSSLAKALPGGVSPNGFIEAKLKVRATTRYWNVVQEVYGLVKG